jgi:3-phenylpropionate/cinnamic acid dioxygenase small subunit
VSSREAVEDFLYHEAALLDAGQLKDWLKLLAEDIDYRIPVRITRDRTPGPAQFSDANFHMLEDMRSLHARVLRFDSQHAWSENPPTRNRRMVSNVRVTGRSGDELQVTSYVLIHRALADAPADLMCAERKDVLRLSTGELKLARRLVLLEHTYLPTENLAFFF